MKGSKQSKNQFDGKKSSPSLPLLPEKNTSTSKPEVQGISSLSHTLSHKTPKLSPTLSSSTAAGPIKASYAPPTRRKSTEAPQNPTTIKSKGRKPYASANNSPSVTSTASLTSRKVTDLEGSKDAYPGSNQSPESRTSGISPASISLSGASVSITPNLLTPPGRPQHNTRPLSPIPALPPSALPASASTQVKPFSFSLLDSTAAVSATKNPSPITLLTIASADKANAEKPAIPKTETNSITKPVFDASVMASHCKRSLGNNNSPRMAALIFSNRPALTPNSFASSATTSLTIEADASPLVHELKDKKEKHEQQIIKILPKTDCELVLQANGGSITITCPIPRKTKIKVSGGDLYVESNIGNEVSINVVNGCFSCDDIGQFCKVTAKDITCHDVGIFSHLISMDGPIHTKDVAASATLQVLGGDVVAEIVHYSATVMLAADHTIYAKKIYPTSIKGGGRRYTIQELDATLNNISNETQEHNRKRTQLPNS